MTEEKKNCLLCGAASKKETGLLYECLRCGLLFKDPSNFWSLTKEKARYLTHNNDVENLGYLGYLNKLLSKMGALTGEVLDFGCGPEKGLEALIKHNKFMDVKVDSYDPIFFPNLLPDKKYDYIYASECFEHFYNPQQEIEKVLSLLKSGGCIGVATNLSDEEDLENWWYTNDPTHVVFYSKKVFQFLAKKYHLEILHIESPHIILKSRPA
ncbi:MAG: methyltransferase domain-containing protein [Bdellovibrionales bacterium]